MNWLKHLGIRIVKPRFHCTQIAEYLINGQRKIEYDLAATSIRYGIPEKMDIVKAYWDAGYETDEIPLHILLAYMDQDCLNALAIFQHQVELIREKKLSKTVRLQCDYIDVLSDLELNGTIIDCELSKKYSEEYKKRIVELDSELYSIAGREINLGSPKQLAAFMFGGSFKEEGIEEVQKTLKSGLVKTYTRKCKIDVVLPGLGFKPPKRKDNSVSTDKNTLQILKPKNKLQKRVIEILLERSNLDQAVSTYFDGLPENAYDSRVHPSFNQTVTRTGRLSSSKPNGQNMPRKGTSPVKKIFKPQFDWIVNADLSQIEWRVAAFLSQDKIAIEEIRNKIDSHADNALNFFDAGKYAVESDEFQQLRTDAKIFLFRLIYGGTPYAFYMDQKMPNFPLPRWEEIVEAFYGKYVGLCKAQNRWVEIVRKQGYLQLPSSRILTFDKVPTRDGVLDYKRANILNYPVQAFATADIMPLAVTVIAKRMKKYQMKSKLLLQVHDSVVADCPDKEKDNFAEICLGVFNSLPQLIKQAWGINFNVPLTGDVEFGPNYGELEKWKSL